jgi:hypothetical protein
VLFFLIWLYLWLRAFYVPLIYDEIATFYGYVHVGKFIPFYAHWDANNHIINSLLSSILFIKFQKSFQIEYYNGCLFFPFVVLIILLNFLLYQEVMVCQWL